MALVGCLLAAAVIATAIGVVASLRLARRGELERAERSLRIGALVVAGLGTVAVAVALALSVKPFTPWLIIPIVLAGGLGYLGVLWLGRVCWQRFN